MITTRTWWRCTATAPWSWRTWKSHTPHTRMICPFSRYKDFLQQAVFSQVIQMICPCFMYTELRYDWSLILFTVFTRKFHINPPLWYLRLRWRTFSDSLEFICCDAMRTFELIYPDICGLWFISWIHVTHKRQFYIVMMTGLFKNKKTTLCHQPISFIRHLTGLALSYHGLFMVLCNLARTSYWDAIWKECLDPWDYWLN